MRKIYLIISLIPVLVWMIIIFFLSEMPTDESNGYSMKIVNKIVEETAQTSAESVKGNKESAKIKQEKAAEIEGINIIFRKFAHAGVYLVLAILVLNLFIQIKGKLNIKLGILGVLCCTLYACTDEFHQLYVDGRTGQFIDVGIDTIGACIGAFLFYIVYLLIKKLKNKSSASNV